MQSIVEIDAPSIGDVEGITMKVCMSWKRTAPLFVEVDPENIAYLRAACKWQMDNGDYKRRRCEPAHHATIDGIEDHGVLDTCDVGDDVPVEDAPVDGVESDVCAGDESVESLPSSVGTSPALEASPSIVEPVVDKPINNKRLITSFFQAKQK